MNWLLWTVLIVLLALPAFAHEGIDDGHVLGTEENASLPLGVLKILQYRETLAASITFLAAFLAGIVSFTSPCGFVLLPTFFTFLFRKRAALMTALFTLGMMIGFMTLGITAALAGEFINQFRAPFAVIAGGIFIVFGLLVLFNKGFGFKAPTLEGKTPWHVLFFGAAFSIGWSPCIGPVLGGILLLAATTGSVLKGAVMLGFFALGVGLPLFILALLSDKYDIGKWFRGKELHFDIFGQKIVTHTYNIISAAILIFIGIIMLIWKGTAFFELTVTRFVPWSMTFFYGANDALQQNVFFTSGFAEVIGVLVGVAVLAWIVWRIRKH